MPALACRFCDASDRCVGARLLQQRRPRRRLVQIRTHGICARIESGFTDPGSRHITRRRLHVQAHTASLQLAAVDSPAPHKQPVALLWLAVSLGFAVSRWSPQWQGCVLLLLEGLYAILHLYPLLHLVNFIGPAAAEHFMHAMTRAQYFGTELWLLAMLICCVPLRRAVGTPVLAVHITVHVLYFSLTLVAPRWCVQQNVQRIQVVAFTALKELTSQSVVFAANLLALITMFRPRVPQAKAL